MDVRLERAYEPAASSDGYRALIDRLWPRGVSRARARLDEWERMGTLTLAYGAKDTEHNDAVVLAEVLRRGLPRMGKDTSKPQSRKGASA